MQTEPVLWINAVCFIFTLALPGSMKTLWTKKLSTLSVATAQWPFQDAAEKKVKPFVNRC